MQLHDTELLLGVFGTLLLFDVITAYFLLRLHFRLAFAEERFLGAPPSGPLSPACITHSEAVKRLDARVANVETMIERNSLEIAQIRTTGNANRDEIIAGMKASHVAIVDTLTKNFMPQSVLRAALTDLYRRTEALDSNGTKVPPFDPDVDK